MPRKHASVFNVGDENEHLRNILCPTRSEKGEKNPKLGSPEGQKGCGSHTHAL